MRWLSGEKICDTNSGLLALCSHIVRSLWPVRSKSSISGELLRLAPTNTVASRLVRRSHRNRECEPGALFGDNGGILRHHELGPVIGPGDHAAALPREPRGDHRAGGLERDPGDLAAGPRARLSVRFGLSLCRVPGGCLDRSDLNRQHAEALAKFGQGPAIGLPLPFSYRANPADQIPSLIDLVVPFGAPMVNAPAGKAARWARPDQPAASLPVSLSPRSVLDLDVFEREGTGAVSSAPAPPPPAPSRDSRDLARG